MKNKIFFISLGCDKNLVDSERMLGILGDQGYELTNDETEAEYIIVNSCCFIGDAKEESINTILEMTEYKKAGCCRGIVVTGCLAERYREEILKEMPEVDAVLGTASWSHIAEVIRSLEEGNASREIFDDLNSQPEQLTRRVLTTGGHYAFLKIAEGCDKHCTYCIIPKVRGSYRSVPMEQLVEEAAVLAEQGVKELILVAQETTLYGVDLYGKKSLHQLLERLSEVPGIYWIRIQYCYPEEITDELIGAIRDLPKVCRYLDIPVQHASDRILRRMGRRTNRAKLEEMIGKLRQEIPDIALRTTLITGFPGETEEDHQIMMDFVEAMRFDRLGVFAYSQEEDTPAAEMEDQIPEEVKLDRRDAVMELQQDIAFEKAREQIDRVMTVMVEGSLTDSPAYVARTYMDAPNVDGYIFIQTEENLMTGDFVRVKVTGALEYDLIGEIYNEFAE
ncbi:MAG: 30S ribosomal protein S12 methylthiotransferase RimO [Clostridiales bacterium]|nr:30S ribosomal protein S12 methylthiotransferase RimO [Clostridiales bacterium]